VFLLLHDALVKLNLQLAVLALAILKLTEGLLDVGLSHLLNVLQIEEQHFFGLLVLSCFIGLGDLSQVVILLVEQELGVLNSVEQIEVLSVFIRFEVQRVEKVHETLVELRKFNVGGTSFDLALDYRNLAVFSSQKFLLVHEF